MPTVFIDSTYRFFSCEETRNYVHISSPNGELKIWLEPEVSVAKVVNLLQKDVNESLAIVKARKGEIKVSLLE